MQMMKYDEIVHGHVELAKGTQGASPIALLEKSRLAMINGWHT
jgi:hypothetical protein